MPKSRKLVQQSPLSLSELLTTGYCAAKACIVVRPDHVPRTALHSSHAVATLRTQMELYTQTVEFLFFVARGLMDATGEASIPESVRAEIYRLWSAVREVSLTDGESPKVLDSVVLVTCHGTRLSASDWRRVTAYYKSSELASAWAPGPITQRVLMTALDSPIVQVREIGMLLVPHVVPEVAP